jgi:hypothetical protein
MNTWADASSAVISLGSSFFWTDTSPAAARKFYRVIELPQ